MTTKKTIARLRAQIRTMTRLMERYPETHMRFGVLLPDGTVEEPTQCADWCHACKLDRLQKDVEQWKSHEAAARGFAMRLAQMQGHFGSILAHIQAGEYAKALSAITAREEREATRTTRTVVSILAVLDDYGKLGCCDDEQYHVVVTVLTWSGRRAYITGASPFIAAVGETVLEDVHDLKDVHFYTDLPLQPPPAMPEPGEHLEWPNLELTPPTEEIERRLKDLMNPHE